MPLLTAIEAAMKLGISFSLLEYLQAHCPKSGEGRLLPSVSVNDQVYFDEKALESYRVYLNQPWPFQKGTRPTIPDAIKKDVREESHQECAICGNANNGEIAHIEAVAATLNNSPDNLIFLCPNHHTQYDLGYKPSNNITPDTVKAAKQMKRQSRVRMQRFEANATSLLHSITSTLKQLNKLLLRAETPDLATVYETEIGRLMVALPNLLGEAERQAKKDQPISAVGEIIGRIAPSVAKFTAGVTRRSAPVQIRNAVRSLISSVDTAMVELDEVECPHCNGRGLTGLVGDFCKFCDGDMVVSAEKASSYDPAEIDEVNCPRCGGAGTTGRIGDICAYCKGSCVVSKADADEYDPDEIDEVDCPHCGGTGTTGLNSKICQLCNGSCFVSKEVSEAFIAKYR